MPLSEHEQRIFEQLEAQLHAEDPRLAARLGGRPDPRRVGLGVALGVAGLAVVLAGVSLRLVPVGVLGAVLLGAGILVALDARRSGSRRGTGRAATADRGARRSAPDSAAGRSGRDAWMRRLEQRWEERRSEGL